MTGDESGGQGPPPDGTDAEEAERCPICLGVLAGGDLAIPDSCCHVFCPGCLLTWAELQMIPSCPVDRRPFRNVYRWDGSLRCVKVPVRTRVAEPEAEICVCRNPEHRVCLKSTLRKRSRQQRAEKVADSKPKGLVWKCNDDDTSSVSWKKVRGTECCAWPSSPFLSLATSTQQDITEPMLVPDDILYETKQCKRQVQECPWFSPAAPITANGTARFLPVNSYHSPFTFGLCSSPITSTSSFGSGHFVFQGVVCAITCPKGGEKRGERDSNSKAPTKKAVSLPSRRSGRNSKAQSEPPVSDPSSPPQSSVSDSDSSASQASKPGGASQVPAKRKGKQVTNRKASGKRKNTRKKHSSEFVESPSASEDEEGEGVDTTDKEDEKDEAKPEMNNSDQPSDTEGSLNADHNAVGSPDGQQAAESLNSNVEHDTNETDKDSNEQTEPDENCHLSCPLDSPPKSPGSEYSDGKSSTEEEEPTVMSFSTLDDEKITTSPESEPDNTLENLMSPDCNNVSEQDDKMETCEEGSEERNNDNVSQDLQTESCDSPKPRSPCAKPSEEKVAVQEAKASEDSKTPEIEEPSKVDNLGKRVEDKDLSKDDTNVVPMDCSSPMSEAGSGTILEKVKESTASATAETPVSIADQSCKDQGERDPIHERKNGRQRRSRFHSPTSSWSPKRDSRREASRRSRSHSRERASSPLCSHSSRTRSKERERERDKTRDYARRERSRERKRRRSRSRSRSKSRSPSRARSYRRGYSPEWPPSRDQSPRGKERRGGWRSGQGGGSGGEARRCHGGGGRFENGVPSERSPECQGWSENPDWVTEKTRGEAEGRNWDFGGGSRWEDRGARGRGGYERGQGVGNHGFHNQQEDDNRRQPRNNSGMGNNSGNDAYSRFNENRGGSRRKQELDAGDSVLDRSGWSSASSWAVRRTLPADVQDYYSKRERGGVGGWNRSEEEQPAADPAKSEPAPATIPGNAPMPVLTAMPPPPPPQLNVLHHQFPLQGPRGPMPVSLQPAAPFAMPPPIPVHVHPAVPLLQVPALGAQALPPPPPPPPPMQQGGQMAAAQPDGQTTQMGAYGKPGLLLTPTKVGQQAVSQVQPSSTSQPAQHQKAQADSSKKEKKQQIQEKAINEVKAAIKPYYQKKEITKEEYKEIVRKAVEKVCHSKSGEVNSSKVAILVKAYVDKYKHVRKK